MSGPAAAAAAAAAQVGSLHARLRETAGNIFCSRKKGLGLEEDLTWALPLPLPPPTAGGRNSDSEEEEEWERAAASRVTEGNFAYSHILNIFWGVCAVEALPNVYCLILNIAPKCKKNVLSELKNNRSWPALTIYEGGRSVLSTKERKRRRKISLSLSLSLSFSLSPD